MASRTTTKKPGLADRLRGKRPVEDTYEVILDPGPLQKVREADNALGLARLVGKDADEIADLERALEQAKQAADEADASITLHLHGLTRAGYEALILRHPPAAEAKEKGEVYDAETFAPALVALCVVDPESSVRPLKAEDVEELYALPESKREEFLATTGRPLAPHTVEALWEEWNQGEVVALFHKAVGVSTQTRNPTLPFG